MPTLSATDVGQIPGNRHRHLHPTFGDHFQRFHANPRFNLLSTSYPAQPRYTASNFCFLLSTLPQYAPPPEHNHTLFHSPATRPPILNNQGYFLGFALLVK
jgi:hypothetical protein